MEAKGSTLLPALKDYIRPELQEVDPLKRAALYMRVSTVDQHPETQLHELRQFASQRGFEIVEEYTDLGSAEPRRGDPRSIDC